MKIAPSEDDDECCVSEKFSKSVSTLPRFLHMRVAGNMDPLTVGGDARMIRWSDRWLLIVHHVDEAGTREISQPHLTFLGIR